MSSRVRFSLILAAAAAIAAPALAQTSPNRAEPWRGPSDQPGTRAVDNRARVTSDETATQPTAAEQHEARALAAAVFAKPAAGQRAADNVAPVAAPDLAEAQPKTEWVDKTTGIVPGGRGLKVTKPF